MKKILLLTLLALMFCKAPEKKTPPVEGAYQLERRTININGDKNSTGFTQLKLYSDTHVMYAGLNHDSSAVFGIGFYKTVNGQIEETLLFSANDTLSNNQPDSYVLEVTGTDSGIIQNRNGAKANDSGAASVKEEYKKVSTSTSDRLEGGWILRKMMNVENGDTTVVDFNGYLMYADGYFMYGHHNTNSEGKTSTNIGYGTYKMQDAETVIEVAIYSSYGGAGQPVNIKASFPDENTYQQVMKFDESTTIEIYERLKQ